LRKHHWDRADIAARSLNMSDVGVDGWLGGHRCPPTLLRYGG
jgi:hypothetical protein